MASSEGKLSAGDNLNLADQRFALHETSLDTLRFAFKLAEQGHQLQLGIKEQIERKATSLIGFAGLAVALQSNLLADFARQSRWSMRDKWTIGAFVASLILIIASCIFSLLATRIWSYAFPDMRLLCSLEEIRRNEVIVIGRAMNALLEATSENASTNGRKARFLQIASALFVSSFLILVPAVLWVWINRLIQ